MAFTLHKADEAFFIVKINTREDGMLEIGFDQAKGIEFYLIHNG